MGTTWTFDHNGNHVASGPGMSRGDASYLEECKERYWRELREDSAALRNHKVEPPKPRSTSLPRWFTDAIKAPEVDLWTASGDASWMRVHTFAHYFKVPDEGVVILYAKGGQVTTAGCVYPIYQDERGHLRDRPYVTRVDEVFDVWDHRTVADAVARVRRDMKPHEIWVKQ